MDTAGSTLDDFLHWKLDALRKYLCDRGLSRNGTRSELAALCFAAFTMNLPLKKSSIELSKDNEKHYNKLLCIDGAVLPDPLTIFDKWVEEKQGMFLWPPVFITDITSFLMTSEHEEQARIHLNQYKIGKAYEYFTSQWLKEAFYHPISPSSEVCFLRAKCVPSQRLNLDPHTVWVCCVKETGEVKSAYCSCTAGLGQTCNHVAGLLFRIEHANTMGLTSCTSSKCAWVAPGKTGPLPPSKLKDMDFKKSQYGKKASRPLVGNLKAAFNVLPCDISTANIQQSMMAKLTEVQPSACVLKGKPKLQEEREILKLSADSQPKPIVDISKYSMEKLVSTSTEELASNDVQIIQEATAGQSDNPRWAEMRRGRVTASNFYAVHTKVTSYKKKDDCDMKPIIKNIMGYTSVNPNVKSLKYGREMEPVAKKAFLKVYCKRHKNVTSSECGIFLDKRHPFLGASPDLLLSCSCCGEGLLEIKCPMVKKCEICLSFCTCNLPSFLTKTNPPTLKKLGYYAQVQGQMALANRPWCEFFVYTCNGSYCEKVFFDDAYYNEMLNNIIFFFMNFIKPETQTRSLQAEVNTLEEEEPMEIDHHETVFFCPVCNDQIREDVEALKDRSIACDCCNLWYHFRCVSVTNAFVKSASIWKCSKCT